MMVYEKDLIYKILPDLTHAIENLTAELKRYNDNKEKTEDTENGKENNDNNS